MNWEFNDSAVKQLRLIGDDDFEGNSRVREFLEQIEEYTPRWTPLGGEEITVFELAGFRVLALRFAGTDVVVHVRELEESET